MRWLKPLLLVVGFGHLLVGLYGLYAPATVARIVSIDLLTPGAFGEARAVFGGLIGALGIAIIRGALGGAGGRQWLFAVATGYTGMVVGRILSLGADGPTWHTLFTGLVEGGLAIVLFWAGMEVGRERAAAPLSPAASSSAPAPKPAPAPPPPQPTASARSDGGDEGGGEPTRQPGDGRQQQPA